MGNCNMRTAVVAVSLIVLFATSSTAALKTNDPAPAFSLRDSGGKNFSLNDVAGGQNEEKNTGVVLSFFASWCMPCRNELPILNSLVDELKKKGVQVVLVGVKEDFKSINALLADLKVDKPLVLSDLNGAVTEHYQVRFLPVTFLIGGDGKIKHVIYGEVGDAQSLRDSVGAFLINRDKSSGGGSGH